MINWLNVFKPIKKRFSCKLPQLKLCFNSLCCWVNIGSVVVFHTDASCEAHDNGYFFYISFYFVVVFVIYISVYINISIMY